MRFGRTKPATPLVLAILCVGCVSAVLLPAAIGLGADESRVYRPQHRSALELLALAQASLGEAGSAVVDGDSIVLFGSVSALRKAVALLEARDLARRMLTLTLEAASRNSLRSAGRRVSWTANAGSLEAGLLEELGSIGEGNAPAKRGARSISSSRGEDSRYTVRVQEGAAVRLEFGHLEERTRSGLLFPNTTILEANSGLIAKPELLGDGRILLTLEWSEGRIAPGGEVLFSRLHTTLRAEPGQVVVLASSVRRRPQPAGRELTARSVNERNEQVVLLRVAVDCSEANCPKSPVLPSPRLTSSTDLKQ